ncbi:MBL fold metallo-hydrolase [Cryptosporangium aurantiacum]|uniref:Ribonuclease BN, tRNA processing enzyme n=1 Tax=Cryptosporangium aurantiacum TaxID=134849 RepID=A0A1M7RA04_9ACTN|nr:MBL fold metallo-hydrolase [Cryptosporangium aurantiacum]SHN43066.1 Ribonuclease BN, tRNA processing enzyme [Cryptosporangium aurantiacum]
MRLTILGCRAGVPADGEPSSGYLVETAATRLLLDCGPGIATALSGILPAVDLDAVILSHLHSDHCYDLLPIGKSLLNRLAHFPGLGFETAGEFRPVPLYVPAGSGDLLRRWAGLFPVASTPILDRAFEVAFDVREYSPGDVVTVGDCTITLVELRHAAPNCGIRVLGPDSALAYTGDTGMTPALIDLARGVDLLVAEATLAEPDPGPHGHLCGREAGRVAAEAAVGALLLTHLPTRDKAWLDANRAAAAGEFDGPIRIARPAERIEIRAGR